MNTLIKNTTIGLLMFLLMGGLLVAQEETVVEDKPVRSPFESGILIDNQTSVIPAAKTL